MTGKLTGSGARRDSGPAPDSVSTSGLLLFVGVACAARLAVYVAAAQGHGGFVEAMCRWDCAWYLSIVNEGYDRAPRPPTGDHANWAFFPAYPALAMGLRWLSGATGAQAALLVNLLLFPLLVLLACRYDARTRGGGDPREVAVLFCFWPYGIYYASAYTEALFGVLILAVALGLLAGSLPLAAAAAAVLSATRPTGVALVLVFAAGHAAPALRALVWPRGDGAGRAAALPRLVEAAALAGVGALGLAGYMIYLHGLVGDALAFQSVQTAWDRSFGNPFGRLWDGLLADDLRRLFDADPKARDSVSYLAGAGLLALLLCAWLAARGRFVEAAAGALPVLAALATGLNSVPRYAFANPVLVIAAFDLVRRAPAPVRMLALAAAATGQAAFLGEWHEWASFLQ